MIEEFIPIRCCYCGKIQGERFDEKFIFKDSSEIWCQQCKKINTLSLYRTCVICKMKYIPETKQAIKLCHDCEPILKDKI